ncbi:signal transduction histidine kinase [Alkalibacillus flavidus]|uniref:histidine kinase n=1 Tax=Alkalibacillus flavidus TaxID=546021 RepID=A0ABV2KTL4_9BACI
MMKKLSFRIGMLFFVLILIIESLLFVTLYTNLANQQVDEVMSNLLARGNTHRDVLEDHYDQSTIEHVATMESSSQFIVVITDNNGEVIARSNDLNEELEGLIQQSMNLSVRQEGEMIEDDWRHENYIASSSPINVADNTEGYVMMFAETSNVKQVLSELANQFKWASILTLILTIVTILILSKFMTTPLIRIKEATEQINKGEKQIHLNTSRQDELGSLARSITDMSNELDQLKSERSEFLSNISHELRTPLTYIKGYADIINRPNTSFDDRKKYSLIIKEESEQLSILIKNLFDLAKVDQNKFMINQEWVSLCELIQDVMARLTPAFNDKQLTVESDCSDELMAYVDPPRIRQVLLNILDNARKFSNEGGKVSLNVTTEENTIIIKIVDEGEGVPVEELPYVFDRLYRVEKSRSRLSGGSGVGLTITKEIIESHGGTIEMDSELGNGTTVTVSLPKGD